MLQYVLPPTTDAMVKGCPTGRTKRQLERTCPRSHTQDSAFGLPMHGDQQEVESYCLMVQPTLSNPIARSKILSCADYPRYSLADSSFTCDRCNVAVRDDDVAEKA